MDATDRYFLDEQRNNSLNRIAAAIENATKANREWFDMNRAAIESRVAADEAYLELTRLQIEEARRRLAGPKIAFMGFGDAAKAYSPPQQDEST